MILEPSNIAAGCRWRLRAAPYLHPRLNAIAVASPGSDTGRDNGATNALQILAVPRGCRVEKDSTGAITVEGQAVELKPVVPFERHASAISRPTRLQSRAPEPLRERERFEVREAEVPANVSRLDSFRNRRDNDDDAKADRQARPRAETISARHKQTNQQIKQQGASYPRAPTESPTSSLTISASLIAEPLPIVEVDTSNVTVAPQRKSHSSKSMVGCGCTTRAAKQGTRSPRQNTQNQCFPACSETTRLLYSANNTTTQTLPPAPGHHQLFRLAI